MNILNYFKSNAAVIAEIHNEFDTAEERIAQQANSLLAELKIPTETSIEEKAKRLRKLGFVSTKEVEEAQILEEKRKKQATLYVNTKEQAKLLMYYKRTYPFQKFLTEQELQRICDKYNLIYAPVHRYKEAVPSKNLKDMEQVTPMKTEDSEGIRYVCRPNNSNISSACPKELRAEFSEGINAPSPWEARNIILKKYGAIADMYVRYWHFDWKTTEVNKEGFFIAAPKSHFDLSGLKNEKGNKYAFLSIIEKEIKDPIVFDYCKGGFIRVVTKWGLEASDPALLNEIDN